MSRVSVVMSTYTEPICWIQQSIDSILNQSFTDFEFIIINDNPEREDLKDCLEYYQDIDTRVKVICNSKNIGLTRSLNKGMEIAKGEYIARMDADDISIVSRFEKQVNLLDSMPDIGVCGSNIRFFGGAEYVYEFPRDHKDMFWFLKNYMAHPASMIRKSILHNEYYDPKFVVSQDYALWIRLYEEGVIMYNIQEVLLCYRKSDEQISIRRNTKQKELSMGLRVRAFNHYCKENNIDVRISKGEVTRALIQEIDSKLQLPLTEKRELLFSLLLSLRCSNFSYIYTIIKFSNRVSVNQFFRLLVYKLRGLDLQMY